MSKKARRGIFYVVMLMLIFGLSFGATYVVITKPFSHAERGQTSSTPSADKPSYEELEQQVTELEEMIEQKDKRIIELEDQLDSKSSPKTKTTSKPKA